MVISGVREEEQPLLDCILLRAVFFVNSIDQCPSVSGIIGEEGELVNGRGGRGGAATTLLPPSAASPGVSFALLWAGGERLFKGSLSCRNFPAMQGWQALCQGSDKGGLFEFGR